MSPWVLSASTVATYLAGSTQAYFGFSASTGGLTNHTEVHILSLATSIIPLSVTVADLLGVPFPAAYAVTLADSSANLRINLSGNLTTQTDATFLITNGFVSVTPVSGSRNGGSPGHHMVTGRSWMSNGSTIASR